MNHENNPAWRGWQRPALVCGSAGVILASALGIWEPASFFRAYLTVFNFCLGIPLGCLAILLLHQLTGGVWGYALRPILHAAAATIPVLGLLFVPLLFSLPILYPWARADEVAADPLLQHRSIYLNTTAFTIRAVVYFAIWSSIGLMLLRQLPPPGAPDHEEAARRQRSLSGPALLLYGLSITLASIDWLMSLQSHWYSTIFPVIVAVGQVLSAFAFAIAVLGMSANPSEAKEVVAPETFQNLGSLLLAFVMLWAYVAFAQFLLVWAGNLPEEIEWYQPRLEGGWQGIALVLLVFQFALPFLFLLSRDVKRNPRLLALLAAFVLFLHFVELVWLVIPAFPPEGMAAHLVDLIAAVLLLAGLGGIWAALFLHQLKNRLGPLSEAQA